MSARDEAIEAMRAAVREARDCEWFGEDEVLPHALDAVPADVLARLAVERRASGPMYLYGHGRRRHIAADPEPRQRGGPALCGNWFRTDAATVEDFTRWLGAVGAERRMVKLRALPLCKACEKAAQS